MSTNIEQAAVQAPAEGALTDKLIAEHLPAPAYHDGFGRSPDLWTLAQIGEGVRAALAALNPQPKKGTEEVAANWGALTWLDARNLKDLWWSCRLEGMELSGAQFVRIAQSLEVLRPEAQATAPAHDADGEAFRTAARFGLTLRFDGGVAQSASPGTPSAYEVVSGQDRAAAMRQAVSQAAAVIAAGGESHNDSMAKLRAPAVGERIAGPLAPHPIADIICAWANGFRVEFRYRHHNPGIPEEIYLSDERWHLCGKAYSAWSGINEHRIHADDLAAWEAFKRAAAAHPPVQGSGQ